MFEGNNDLGDPVVIGDSSAGPVKIGGAGQARTTANAIAEIQFKWIAALAALRRGDKARLSPTFRAQPAGRTGLHATACATGRQYEIQCGMQYLRRQGGCDTGEGFNPHFGLWRLRRKGLGNRGMSKCLPAVLEGPGRVPNRCSVAWLSYPR